MSENISAAITLNGEVVTKQPLIKSMRVVKKETLKLISGWISRTEDHALILDNFIPPLLEAVLLDYQVRSLAVGMLHLSKGKLFLYLKKNKTTIF